MSDQRDGGISWTDETWNPVRGCSRVSPGCVNCYAEGVAARFSGPGLPYEGLARRAKNGEPRWTGEVRMVPEHLADPLRWKRPRRVFVNSMSDLFHEKLTNEEIAAVFGVMAAAPQHTFQVLTKRAARLPEWFAWVKYAYGEARNTPAEGCRFEAMKRIEHQRPDGSALPGPTRALYGYDMRWPLPNVWIGVSAENQDAFDERWPHLRATPAAVHFLSLEPLLGPIDVSAAVNEARFSASVRDGIRQVPLWVIVGGESGQRARPMDVVWAEDIVRQCRAAGTDVFVKQLGAVPFDSREAGRTGEPHAGGAAADPDCRLELQHRKGGDMSEWPESLRVREFPAPEPRP